MNMNDDLLKKMLEKGYIEAVGYNPVGDMLYKITPLFYKEQAQVAQWIKEQDSDTYNNLWFKGFIDIKMSDDGFAYIYLTSKSEQWVDSEELNDDEKAMMYLIYSSGYYVKENFNDGQERN